MTNSSCRPSIFLWKKPTVVLVRISRKINIFFWFEISLPQASKSKKTSFATKNLLQNFERHDHWHCLFITFWVIFKVCEIMLLKYGDLMLQAGHTHILDVYRVQLHGCRERGARGCQLPRHFLEQKNFFLVKLEKIKY